MLFRSLADSLKLHQASVQASPGRLRRRPFARRMQLEALEDRYVPATHFAYNLGTLGGVTADARDVNASAQVVGSSATAPGSPSGGVTHAFVWNRGTMIDL